MNRRTFILGALAAFGLTAGGGAYFVGRPEFGRLPSGARLEKIKTSPHYKNGAFQNLVPVEVMSDDGENRIVATAKFLFGDKSALSPKQPLPSAKTDLFSLGENFAVWMGHSTFFIRFGGKNIIVDPVFSPYASPIFFINRAFAGSNVYAADDIPPLDVLAITHDHWDHLDYPSIMALKEKTKAVVCPLGVGEHFDKWGFAAEKIFEGDWYDEIKFGDDFSAHVLPSQHFSGRFLKQNPTLWCGFAFVARGKKIYVSGDGGYGEHFRAIGEKFGGFDAALMENGQYNLAWHHIHMLPDETAQAAQDVRAKIVVPSHGGKFALARHAWQEPYRALTAASEDKSYKLLTPKIGEAVNLFDETQNFSAWWEEID